MSTVAMHFGKPIYTGKMGAVQSAIQIVATKRYGAGWYWKESHDSTKLFQDRDGLPHWLGYEIYNVTEA